MQSGLQLTQKYLLPVAALTYLAYSVFGYLSRSGKVASTAVVLIAATFFNPYMLGLITTNYFDTAEQITWAVFVISDAFKSQSSLHYVWLAVSTAFNPSNCLFFIIKILNASNKKLKICFFAIGLAITLLYMQHTQRWSIQDYSSLYFPESFEPQFNLIWMLYAHMFNRYLHLYQIVFLFLQVSSVYLISSLQFRHHFKIVLLTYFKVYCNYRCSELCLVLALGLSLLFMHEQISIIVDKWSALNKNTEVIKAKTLTLIIAIANIAFLPLDKILLSKYLHDFSINIGYLFLFFGFPWILNSVYLAEISLNINELNIIEQKVTNHQESYSINAKD